MTGEQVPVIGIDCHVMDSMKQGSQTYLHCLLEHFPRTSVWKELDLNFRLYSTEYHEVYEALGNRGEWSRIRRKSTLGRFLDLPLQMAAEGCSLGWYQYNVAPTAFLVGHRFILTIHDVLFFEMPQFYPWSMRVRLKFLGQLSANRARHVLTVSEYSKKEIHRWYGIPLDRITVTENSAQRTALKTWTDAEGEMEVVDVPESEYLLFLGRLDPRKNLKNLIRAFRHVLEAGPEDRDLHLVIAGPGDIDRYREVAIGEGIENQVHFPGEVSERSKEKLYAGCSAFVYPSYGEGFGLPVLEAFSFGKEVVTTRNTSLEEIATPCAHFVEDPDDISQMAQCIMQALALSTDNNHALDLQNHAGAYSWERTAGKVLHVILSCV